MRDHADRRSVASIAALLGADLDDPIQQLAVDLAHGDRRFLDALVAERKRQKLKQEEVAERMGVSQSAVSQFEAGDRDPQLSTIRRYALALGVMVEHRLVRLGRAELIQDEAVRARAGLDRMHMGPDPHTRRSRRRGFVVVDAEGPRVPATAAVPTP